MIQGLEAGSTLPSASNGTNKNNDDENVAFLQQAENGAENPEESSKVRLGLRPSDRIAI